jgi:hypothetical protein
VNGRAGRRAHAPQLRSAVSRRIELEDARTGEVIAQANLGNCSDHFAITFVEAGDCRYLARDPVARDQGRVDGCPSARHEHFDPTDPEVRRAYHLAASANTATATPDVESN